MTVEQVSVQEVKRLIDAGQAPRLLDCRDAEELAICRIDGARHIPMGDIPSRIQELDPDEPLIVICHHGVRSRSVAAWLAEQGFVHVRSMSGGIDAWSAVVDPRLPRY